VPVGATETLMDIQKEADEVICPQPEVFFRAVGLWYHDFLPVSDEDVIAILDAARLRRSLLAARASAHP
jgi:putative phosphoribosyl transferase